MSAARRDRERALALAAHVERQGGLELAELADEFERRGYPLPSFARAPAHALDAGLVEWEPGWRVRGAP